jgi:hypothetical protein
MLFYVYDYMYLFLHACVLHVTCCRRLAPPTSTQREAVSLDEPPSPGGGSTAFHTPAGTPATTGTHASSGGGMTPGTPGASSEHSAIVRELRREIVGPQAESGGVARDATFRDVDKARHMCTARRGVAIQSDAHSLPSDALFVHPREQWCIRNAVVP